MADVHDIKTRSYNMSQIKSKDTKPELLVRKFLFANGFRYKLHDKKLSGKPDIVLPKFKSVILVHGCFWHGHDNCKYFVVPKTRADWWIKKIERNKQLDLENSLKLMVEGWKIFTIFECELKGLKAEKTLSKIMNNLNKMTMISQIKNSKDVAAFAKQIIKEGVSFHPDDDFNEYIVIKTNRPYYTKKQAEIRNKLMGKCFEVCEKEGTDIYDIMLEVTLIETGMDKFIPLPSSPYAE